MGTDDGRRPIPSSGSHPRGIAARHPLTAVVAPGAPA